MTGDSGGRLLLWTRSAAENPAGKGPRGIGGGVVHVVLHKDRAGVCRGAAAEQRNKQAEALRGKRRAYFHPE